MFREMPLVPPVYRGNDSLTSAPSPGQFVVSASGELDFGCPDGTSIRIGSVDTSRLEKNIDRLETLIGNDSTE